MKRSTIIYSNLLYCLLFRSVNVSAADVSGKIIPEDNGVVTYYSVTFSKELANGDGNANYFADINNRGDYIIKDLPDGTYKICASVHGYGSTFIADAAIAADTVLHIPIQKNGVTVSILLKGNGKRPLNNLSLIATAIGSGGEQHYSAFSFNGSFKISLNPGIYFFTAKSPDWKGKSATVVILDQDQDQNPDQGRDQIQQVNIFQDRGSNPELARELLEMIKPDQAIRHKLEVLREDDPKLHSMEQDMLSVDRRNQARLNEIISIYGWPGAELVGVEASSAAWLMLHHGPSNITDHFLPVLQKAADAGEIDKSNVALSVDRVLLSQGKKQIYGSHLVRNKQGNYVPSPLEDAVNVNERRRKVGLGAIELYEKVMGDVYNGIPVSGDLLKSYLESAAATK